jgi:hypothetical protein
MHPLTVNPTQTPLPKKTNPTKGSSAAKFGPSQTVKRLRPSKSPLKLYPNTNHALRPHYQQKFFAHPILTTSNLPSQVPPSPNFQVSSLAKVSAILISDCRSQKEPGLCDGYVLARIRHPSPLARTNVTSWRSCPTSGISFVGSYSNSLNVCRSLMIAYEASRRANSSGMEF